MTHMSQKHGNPLESTAQLRQLDRAACVVCAAIRSRRGNRCHFCGQHFPRLATACKQENPTNGAASFRPPDRPAPVRCEKSQ